MRRFMSAMLVGLMTGPPGFAQQQEPAGTFTLKVQSEIVLTNVVVRDKKTGNVVKGPESQRLYHPRERKAPGHRKLRLPER